MTDPAIELHVFEDGGAIPNHPTLPLIVVRAALRLPASNPAAAFEQRFGQHGWARSWRNGIFPFPHFHSTAHEVLGVARGRAEVRLGGAGGIVTTLVAGDVVVIPAGVGHQNLGASDDFLVVGAYPTPGPAWDLCHGRPEERPRVLENIAAVPLPASDPLHGSRGPLRAHWVA